jgi:hypothetical protein
MNRRDALRTLVLGAGATFTGTNPAAAWHRPDNLDRIAALLRSLPRDRAHVIVADPNVCPSFVRDRMINRLQSQGESLSWLRLDRPSKRRRGVLLIDEPDLPVRRFWLELREQDLRARRGQGMVLATWQFQWTEGADWVPRFGEVAGSVIWVRDVEFDEPPGVIPSYYRIPVEVFRGGELKTRFSLVELVTHRE